MAEGKRVTRSTPIAARPQLTVAEQRGLLQSRSKQFAIQDLFKYGYRNKEDVSNLPPNVLVIGSQNVLTNAAELVGVRQGFVLDGSAGTQNDFGIDSAYDFESRQGTVENLRKWGAHLQVRYLNPSTEVVSWVNLLTTLNSSYPANFTSFWDIVESKRYCLFVNHASEVNEWSGGVGTYASSTALVTGTLATVVVHSGGGGGGSGYTVGDILTVPGGTGGTVKVTGVSGGSITGIYVLTPGSGYSAASNVSPIGGTGTGAAIDTTVQSAGTLTVSGTLTLSQLGFYDDITAQSVMQLVDQNGNTYSYLSVSGQTFQGVTPDSSTGAFAVGDPVIQKPRAIPGTSIVTNGGGNLGIYVFDIISTLSNQVWYGSLASNVIYASKVNNYKDVSFSTPARLPGEGGLMVLDSSAIAFQPDANHMYAAAGTNQWWYSNTLDQTIDVSSVAVPTQLLYMSRLKTSFNQTAQSQALITSFKNSIIYVSNEPIINSFGLVQNIYTEPQIINISDPIKFDVDAYDFTGGSVFYDNYYIYVLIPANNVVRMYNVQKNYWEAPQTIPVSRLYHVLNANGQTELYGHSGNTDESYQLFTGYNDNGNPINAVAAFPYVSAQGGSVDMLKNFNKLYTEGYISANTELMVSVNYDFGGFSGTYSTIISGADTPLIFNNITDGSLGQNTLGTQPVGTILNLPFTPAVPKFRSIKTMPRKDFFESQIVYSTNQVDGQWTLLRFGTAIGGSQSNPVSITQ